MNFYIGAVERGVVSDGSRRFGLFRSLARLMWCCEGETIERDCVLGSGYSNAALFSAVLCPFRRLLTIKCIVVVFPGNVLAH